MRGQALELFEAMGQWYPREPHWYLPLIGADPASQGRELGAVLLAHTLAICDDESVPAYLEATSERSVPLYERHGFEVLTVLRAWAPARRSFRCSGGRAPYAAGDAMLPFNRCLRLLFTRLKRCVHWRRRCGVNNFHPYECFSHCP